MPTICRYCGKPTTQTYCSDTCEFASGQPKIILIDRYHIHCKAYPPAGGWVYGETVKVYYRQWAIEIKPALGGHTLTRVKPKGSVSRAGLVTVDKPS